MSDATGWLPPKRKHDLTECRAYFRAVLTGKDATFKPHRHRRGRLIATWHPRLVEECKQEILASAMEATRRGIRVTDKDVIRIVYGIYRPVDNEAAWALFIEWSERRLLVSTWVEPAALPAPAGHVPTPLVDLPLFGRGPLTIEESDALLLTDGADVLEIDDCDIVSVEVIDAPTTALAIRKVA